MKGRVREVTALIVVLFFMSIRAPQVCFADTLFDRFPAGQGIRSLFGMNYHNDIISVNLTSGTITQKQITTGSPGSQLIVCRVYSDYINVTEEFNSKIQRWYTVDRERRINGTDTRVLWWIDLGAHIGDTVRILDDSYTVIGKGIQKNPYHSDSIRMCWILSRTNVVAYYDTEYGILLNLINITQAGEDIANGITTYYTNPYSGLDSTLNTPTEVSYYTSYPPLITFIILVSVFVSAKYRIPRRIRLWLRKAKR